MRAPPNTGSPEATWITPPQLHVRSDSALRAAGIYMKTKN